MPDTFLIADGSPIDTLTQQHGLAVYFSVIAIGAALIVYAYAAKGQLHARKRLSTIGGAILCAMTAVFFQTKIDKERGFVEDQEKRYNEKMKEIVKKKGKEAALQLQYMYSPKSDSLNWLTLNNPSLAADYVWLTSLQFVSNSFRRGNKFDLLRNFHETMSDLDPHWIEAQINGLKVLSALIDERERSEECYTYDLLKNEDNFKDRWRLRYEAGLLYVMPPNDPKKMAEFSRKAAMYFDQSMVERNFPKSLATSTRDRIARLRLESGSQFYREAETMLAHNATASDTTGLMKDISQRDWLRAHSMAKAAAMTDAAADYKKVNGKYPADLATIAKSFQKPEEFVKDAYKQPFDYDPVTGTVTSHGAKAVRTVQSAHVVNDLINLFRGNHKGRNPEDLAELTTFLRNFKAPPVSPPGATVVDAIGADLDATTGPLGAWKYDAEKGEVILPPECDIKALYEHIYDYDWSTPGVVKAK